jgi:hypothetical protein
MLRPVRAVAPLRPAAAFFGLAEAMALAARFATPVAAARTLRAVDVTADFAERVDVRDVFEVDAVLKALSWLG